MDGSLLPRVPELATLSRKATWVNRAGRVDRSACLEVRASEVRERARMRDVRRGKCGLPHAEARGWAVITGGLLRRLHGNRLPYRLKGDLRTRKSNAMKDPEDEVRKKVVRQLPPEMRGRGGSRMHHSSQARRMFNPNKSASRTKLLGFFAEPEFLSGWSQRVEIVRWRSHERLAMHFLICPSCGEKFLKLFAVLCSKQELDDSLTAEAWIDTMEKRHKALRRPLDVNTIEMRTRLIRRYGLLFRKRRLVCRKCLCMRYGEVRREAMGDAHEKALARGKEQAQREAERERKREEDSSRALAELWEMIDD